MRIILFLGIMAVFLIASFVFLENIFLSTREGAEHGEKEAITYNLRGATDWYVNVLGQTDTQNFAAEDLIGSSVSIIPHDIADIENLAYFLDTLSSSLSYTPETIILLGPDHFSQTTPPFTTTMGYWDTPFGIVAPDNDLTQYIADTTEIQIDEEPFNMEHSIFSIIPFLAKYFPHTEVLPIIVSNQSSLSQLGTLAHTLASYSKNSSILILGSIDFYHGDDPREAYIQDMTSWRILAESSMNNMAKIHSDGNAVLYTLKKYAQIIAAPNFRLIQRTSTEEESVFFTTHLYGTFSKKRLSKKEQPPAFLMFAGDVMLDRYVDEIFKRVGNEAMFGNIKKFVERSDMFVFNFEGTFPDIDIPQNLSSLLFSFRKEIVSALQSASFTATGLANNHSNNFGASIFQETKENLKNLGFEIFGTPFPGTSEQDILIREINGKKIQLYGYNAFGGSVDTVSELIKRNSETKTFDIVFAHWGNEYQQSPSVFQRNTAQKFYEAGADIIIGHHPHVVQPFEKLGEKIVFYSLGNFIFDQYFSERTQHGLLLFMIVENEKVFIFPYPVSLKESVPRVEDTSFLENNELYPGFTDVRILDVQNF